MREGLGFLLLLTLVGMAAYAVGYWVARPRPKAPLDTCGRPKATRAVTLTVAGLAVLLVFKGVLSLRPEIETALFPWTWYIFVEGAWKYWAGFLIFGLGAGTMPLTWNRVVMHLMAGLLLGLMLNLERWVVAEPTGDFQLKPDARHHVFQSTGHTCSPASTAILLSYWGIQASEGEMALLSHTIPGHGTSIRNTHRGLMLKLDQQRRTDLRVRVRAWSLDEIHRQGLPVVATVLTGGIPHAVVIAPCGADFLQHDPLQSAPFLQTRKELAEVYQNFCTVIEPLEGTRKPGITAPEPPPVPKKGSRTSPGKGPGRTIDLK